MFWCLQVGAYSVDIESFERVAIPALTLQASSSVEVLVCDEIGRMELKSLAFQKAMRRLLSMKNLPIVGALTAPRYGHRVPFCDEVAGLPEVAVHNIKKSNRDEVREHLLELAVEAYASTCSMERVKDLKKVDETKASGTEENNKGENSMQAQGLRLRQRVDTSKARDIRVKKNKTTHPRSSGRVQGQDWSSKFKGSGITTKSRARQRKMKDLTQLGNQTSSWK